MIKKWVVILMSLCLCFSVCGCNGGNGGNGGSGASDSLKEPEVLETVALNIVDNLKGKTGKRVFRTEGRTFYRDGGLACDLSCTGVRFTALCKGEIFVKFNVSSECYFTVYVNGERQKERIGVRAPDVNFVKIAEIEEYGEYEIAVVKQSQYPMAYCELVEVQLSGAFGTRPAQRERFIEFYGDSLMNGSNIYKGGTSAATSDATLAFGYVTALALNADCNIIGRGGMALNRHGTTDGMLEIWGLCGGVSSPEVAQYGFDRQPDCVVVEIGDNDYNANHVPNKFRQGVKEMIINLRSVYGEDVKIIWCHSYNDTARKVWDSVAKATLDELNANGTIYYCPIPENCCSKADGGDGVHPDVEGAANMAAALTQFIEENIYA